MNDLEGKRRTYSEILMEVLESYYLGCKTRYARKRKDPLLKNDLDVILGSVEEDVEHEFRHPIERLMWCCFDLILGLRENSKAEEKYRREINNIINTYGLANIMSRLEHEERIELEHDLEMLDISIDSKEQ